LQVTSRRRNRRPVKKKKKNLPKGRKWEGAPQERVTRGGRGAILGIIREGKTDTWRKKKVPLGGGTEIRWD